MNKKLLSVLGVAGLAFALASCDNNANDKKGNNSSNEIITLNAPVLSLSDKTVSWNAINDAKGYVVNVNGKDLEEQSGLSYRVNDEEGEYMIKVKAIASNDSYKNSDYSEEVKVIVEKKDTPIVLNETTLWVVGDSTVSAFTDDYYLPRYGYGTELNRVLDSKVTVKNLALSGRSSRSFLAEANYETLKAGIKSGDYLVIGFGHNDEKSDDEDRYAAPRMNSKDIEKNSNGSYNFQYILNEYYLELATEKGATPILCTPIVRLSNKDDYSGSNGHITSDGDYPECIKNLGANTNTTVIDLTALTKEKYTNLGYDEAKKYHAVTSCKYDTDGKTIIPNYAGLDGTHINKYGAKEVSYLFAKALKETNNSLKNYVLSNIAEPTSDDYNDAINGEKKPLSYQAQDWSNYNTADHFATTKANVSYNNTNVAYGLCGTAFGDTGGDPSSAGNGYIAKEVSNGIYQVGQSKTDNSFKGKMSTSTYGISFLFYQVNKDYNFTMTVNAKIIKQNSDNKQAGFGLMLRDDCYLPTNDKSIVSNYVAAGLVSKAQSSAVANFSHVNGTRADGEAVAATFAVDDEATFTIKRLGQVVTCTTIYGGKTYTKTYTDFDFTAIDSEYMYIGMFAARGIIAEYSNLIFTIDGASQGA